MECNGSVERNPEIWTSGQVAIFKFVHMDKPASQNSGQVLVVDKYAYMNGLTWTFKATCMTE